ncbi:putative nitrogen regulation protein (PAS/PAC domain protein) [Desulforapulum autotrophicum HRM2]|uniref:histidine kinase n=1 Tax=Desulforapulum autotrophicum (strain ATCC 43914 / DSM 3382 / VKM B-1955 / HRM2) TaxID=177437 RepID=C0QLE3_DESAH|nr:ATP-binding protein [Desulforapulum autotrophicum]ACN14229.1 putative nitrogen regulation protein (PAS/PAC domain protein) [Desulforapulum autotrophicum HRM2]
MVKDKTNSNPNSPSWERARRKREGTLILAILFTVGLLTYAETRITGFDTGFPVSSTVLMFILINTNLLLLLALILLVFRNLAKLYYEKKSKILGTKLKTRLVAAFVTLALVPTTVLFFFSIHFITTSIAFWFNAPVEQALENSLSVGRQLYGYVEEKNCFFAKRATFQIHSQKLLAPKNSKELSRYVQVVQRAFNLDGIEIYTPDARRTTLSLSKELKNSYFGILTADELMNIHEGKTSRTISGNVEGGETIRTITTIPFGGDPQKSDAFLVVTALISQDLSQDLASISRGAEEYQQLKMIKRPVQISNYIALSIVALLVIFCAVWFGFYLAKSITIPLMKFAEGTQRVTQGDLNYQIDFQSDDELGTLVNSFNSMTRELALGREKLASSEKTMRLQNIEIEKSRQYMEIVLKNISAGVISLSNTGVITTINKAAETMLDMDAVETLNRNYKEIIRGDHLAIAKKIADTVSFATESVAFPLSATINGSPRHFAVHFNALKSDTNENMGVVMVFDDLTELEKAQRMAAWREVARRIAHEVKNPLTPIKLSAQRLKRRYSKTINEEVFDKCTEMIVVHVDLIRNLVNEFATFARFPDTNAKPCRIEEILDETVALYQEGLENVEITTAVSGDLPAINLDRQQMKQAFINLFDNAVAAINKQGKINIDILFDPILSIVRIEIADNGKGISDEEKTRLFEPYFSTKKSGMGLGLAIVSSIITDHKGMIRVQDNQPVGARFIIELPA